MIDLVVWIIFGIIVLYTILPNLIFRRMDSKIPHMLNQELDESAYENKYIALTFDDGPDERYTGRVLDILKKHDVKATFFVVAKRVLMAPYLIERMVEEGHEVGIHGYQHQSAWLTTPIGTITSYGKALEIVGKYVPEVKWSRPPWGTFNLLTYYGAKRKGLQPVLWSVDARDWSARIGSDLIEAKVIEKTKKNAIIVLHDAGGADGAPNNTINALDSMLEKMKREYKFVLLEEGLCHGKESYARVTQDH